jgi:hypothetical protein
MIRSHSRQSSHASPHRFCWFSPADELGWREALSSELRDAVPNRLILLNALGEIHASLSRFGLPGSPEAGDIKQIKHPSPRPLGEVRWILPGIESPVHLRMYFSCPSELESRAVGLLFRVKEIERTRYLTRLRQNRDIRDAIEILKVAISLNFSPCLDIGG